MVTGGEFDLAQAELDAVTVPTNTPESMQLAGTLALCRSVVASADSRPMGFGLHAVGQWAHVRGERGW